MSQHENNILQALRLLDQKLTASNERLEKLENSLSSISDQITKQNADNMGRIHAGFKTQLQTLQMGFFGLKSLSTLISRKLTKPGKKVIRVVFLVHGVETWDALHDIYKLMLAHERFEPLVITIKRDYLNSGNFAQEELNYDGLQQLGITPAVRFQDDDRLQEIETLRLMEPDIIFRQSAWDISVPPSFHFHEIDFAKIVLVPYGFGLNVMNPDQINHLFTRSCWRGYVETEVHLKFTLDVFKKGSLKFSGSPKMDRILAEKDNAGWPIEVLPGTTRIIWAPHHSITADWLYFSTFMSNYKQFLELARECPNLQIVLKPHPALLSKLVTHKLISDVELLAFLNEFNSLPNTALLSGGNYIPLFWASDILITDGIGFFAEYLVTGKPIIWTENEGHAPLNDVGLILQDGMYRAKHFEDVVGYLEQLCVVKEDPLQERRRENLKTIMPRTEGAAQFIVDDILSGFDEV